MSAFGDRIKQLRIAQRMGIRELADYAGIKPLHLSRIERGKDPPPSDYVISILALTLATDVTTLLSLGSPTDRLIRFLQENPLTENQVNQVEQFIKSLEHGTN